MTSERRNLFLYWIGHEYKLISILRKLIYLHSTNGVGYNVVLITHENIQDYIDTIPSYFYNLCAAHQADYVRVHVVCDYGGIWLDSDTLVLDSLDSLFDIIDNKDGFLITEGYNGLCNGIFGSKKETSFMKLWKKKLQTTLDVTNGNIGWTDIGNSLIMSMFNSYPSLFENYKIFIGLNSLYPVSWENCDSEFITKPYDNYKNIIRDFQPLVVLVQSVYKALEKKTINEILNGTLPLNYFINKSFNNLKLDNCYDFIDIRNGNFATSLEKASGGTAGIRVDTVKYSTKRSCTFSGHWVSNKYTNVIALQHVDNGDLYIYAVHDDGWTKMVGFQESGDRVDGRYVSGTVSLNKACISKAWDSSHGKNVSKMYYTIIPTEDDTTM